MKKKKRFYLNAETGDSLWEPPPGGYTKSDGMLILESGETIIDPLKVLYKESDDYMNNRLCTECFDRVAIRKCKECGDKFCTICYKETHATGTRKSHTWIPTGPIDCTDCEKVLAVRWCVSCDEAFCDPCWKVVHAKGKRKFHPFSEVDIDGKIDERLFTIDGREIQGGYDSTYSQKQSDKQNKDVNLPAFAYDYNANSSSSNQLHSNNSNQQAAEWAEYTDEYGNPYWYNNYTGASQYENPFY